MSEYNKFLDTPVNLWRHTNCGIFLHFNPQNKTSLLPRVNKRFFSVFRSLCVSQIIH